MLCSENVSSKKHTATLKRFRAHMLWTPFVRSIRMNGTSRRREALAISECLTLWSQTLHNFVASDRVRIHVWFCILEFPIVSKNVSERVSPTPGTAMKVLMPAAAVAYTMNHPVISIAIPIVLPILLPVLLPLATWVNWTWAIVLPTALRLAVSWSWTVANFALPVMPLLVPFVDWNRSICFRDGSGFRSVRFLACGYSALQGQPGRLLNCRRRKGKQSKVKPSHSFCVVPWARLERTKGKFGAFVFLLLFSVPSLTDSVRGCERERRSIVRWAWKYLAERRRTRRLAYLLPDLKRVRALLP
jgi:hypothetical protein